MDVWVEQSDIADLAPQLRGRISSVENRTTAVMADLSDLETFIVEDFSRAGLLSNDGDGRVDPQTP